MAVREGQKAPAFSLPSTKGGHFKLTDVKGKKNLVLYFYPKDDTPGCTTEACDFRDLRNKFRSSDTEILGVSFDPLSSHEKFKGKYELPFTLLSDEAKAVAKKYGVYKKKSLYGRSFMGIERTTFVIDRDQKIRKIFPKVKVDGHAKEVLAAVQSL